MCDDHTHDHDHRTHPAPTPGLRAELTRRGILSAAGSGLLMASLGGPALGAVSTGATLATGASRTSRLTRGTTLLHADLHNHSLMSDGDGDPAAAFGSMRAAGLDVAALTDHSTISGNDLADAIAAGLPPEVAKVGGLTPTAWRRTKALADAADEAGAFTALRGFEWSSPLLGHVNVWFTEDSVDLLEARGLPARTYDSMGDVFAKEGLVSSPTEERARLIYALSQELSRTIAEIDGVLSARIHVVLPEADMLGRDVKPSSASVFVRYVPTSNVESYSTQIKLLVANSIEGLLYDNITVVMVPADEATPAAQAEAMPKLANIAGVWVHPASVARLWGMLTALMATATAGFLFAGWPYAAMLLRRRRAADPLRQDGGS